MHPQFIDLHPTYSTAYAYLATNEEPEIHNALLADQSFTRAGGICGGGDIPLLVMLHRAKEVITVDHCYRACAMAFLKAILLDSLGPRRFLALWCETNYQDLQDILLAAKVNLPDILQSHLPETFSAKITPGCYISNISTHDVDLLKKEYRLASEEILEKSMQNLSNFIICHGDLIDLVRYGQFDLFYLSNAMEHLGRTNKHPVLSTLVPMLQPNVSMILSTGGRQFDANHSWIKHKNIKGKRTSWPHSLWGYQDESAAAQVAA